ncbi:uncharacterized protein LOC125874893 isoform X4 [Solanum stenotomum]|uniref:uncharacterized protein LOC125874893 isoform X4 n=1 Tax=Solanum stenotomum TaxID=172797 RepID=UPI0020D1D782|nr:uncharacterized protein LOC125874893 isoform X4 [Solanum stenotomum]
MGSLNSSLKVGSLIWFCLKLLKIRKSDDKICLFEKVGIGARLENIHTYKTIGSLVIGLCRFLRVTSRRLLSLRHCRCSLNCWFQQHIADLAMKISVYTAPS